ncbi:MAG: T9SS type A sorting domain-containing protein [Bacteroidales bacterium]|nr:T9SS type A sorting domain-containing protein [Candidatus Latescibacterota bacterium]
MRPKLSGYRLERGSATLKTRRAILKMISVSIGLAGLLVFLPEVVTALEGWQDDIRLSDDPDISFPPPNNGKFIAIDHDGAVHVVWADYRDRNFEIYHRYRSSGVWSTEERLTFTDADSKRPVLAVDDLGRVHLVYNDLSEGNKEIYHMIWDGSWSMPDRVSMTPGDSYASCLATDGLTLHLVYQEEVNGYLQVIYRSRDVFTWSPPEQISFIESGMSMVPTVAVGPDGTVHVAWWDTRVDPDETAEGRIAYRSKTSSWSEEEIASGPAADAMRPNIIVDDSGTVFVAWIDKREIYEQIYYNIRSTEGWATESQLTIGSYTHYHPSLAASEGKLHLIYWGNSPSASNAGVFYSVWDYQSWSPPVRLSDTGSMASLCTLAAEADGTLHAAWKDTRDGNEEIYYNTLIPNGTGVEDGEGEEGPDIGDLSLFMDIAPNPSAGDVRISMKIPIPSDIYLRVYDVKGRIIRRLSSGHFESGVYPFIWDGRNDSGNMAAGGIYFIRCNVGKKRISGKVILLRY